MEFIFEKPPFCIRSRRMFDLTIYRRYFIENMLVGIYNRNFFFVNLRFTAPNRLQSRFEFCTFFKILDQKTFHFFKFFIVSLALKKKFENFRIFFTISLHIYPQWNHLIQWLCIINAQKCLKINRYTVKILVRIF